MITYEDIIKSIQLDKTPIQRNKYDRDIWKMEDMLGVVEEIGRSIDPRFVIDDANREVYKNLIYWVMNDDRMAAIDPRSGKTVKGRTDKGIYLAGNTGTGKTVAFTILRKLYALNPFRDNNKNPLGWSERRADEIVDVFATTGDISHLKTNHLLCIQDLGCEPQETVYMGNRVRVLPQLIGYRGDRKDLITMVTSNIPLRPEVAQTKFGDRATSRMIEMMNYLTLTGQDRRMKI